MRPMQFLIQPRSKNRDDHSIVGYDPVSERVVFTMRIPSTKNDLLGRFVRFEPDDPNGYDAYEISYSNVKKLVNLLGGKTPPERLDYFIEPWVSANT